jgi:hypothetical protein
LGNPLCRGVDELCTELLDTRKGCVAQLLDHLKRFEVALTEDLELKRKDFGLKTEIFELQKENFRLDCLLNYHSKEEAGCWPSPTRAKMCSCTTTNSNRDPPKWRPWQ